MPPESGRFSQTRRTAPSIKARVQCPSCGVAGHVIVGELNTCQVCNVLFAPVAVAKENSVARGASAAKPRVTPKPAPILQPSPPFRSSQTTEFASWFIAGLVGLTLTGVAAAFGIAVYATG